MKVSSSLDIFDSIKKNYSEILSKYKADVPESVYHVTTQYNADKIIEFGFDLDLAGQATMQRFRKRKRLTIDDKFVIERETLLEHSAINTSLNTAKHFVHYADCLLQITLKPDAKILDKKKLGMHTYCMPRPQRGGLIFGFAKENGFDGILSDNYLLIFGNKIISKIEKVEDLSSR